MFTGTNKYFFSTLFFLTIVSLVYITSSCTKRVWNPPTVGEIQVSSITGNSAKCFCETKSDGGFVLTKMGICWDMSPNPTISNNIIEDYSGNLQVNADLISLYPGTTYYVRGYASNEIGLSYGKETYFTTSILQPSLTTYPVSEISSTQAICGGLIISNGGATITSRGVCWSSSQNPTIANSKSSDGIGNGSFISSIIDLLPGTAYYVRAYATNSQGTAYGSQVSFSTSVTLPSVTTTSVTDITNNSAKSGGQVLSDGGAPVSAKGVCWGTSPNPTISNSKSIDGAGTGPFTSSITGLSPSTTYYIRAYATNYAGTNYGNQATFTTQSNLANITTTSVTSVTSATAISGGTILSDGGSAVTARGVCWSTSPNPTITNSKTSNGTGAGAFTSNLTGLIANTLYNVRAYATNSQGTAYGSQISFTTGQALSLATVTTTAATNITTTGASLGGNVTSDGNATVTEKGVVYSTTQNPTTSNTKISSGSGTGAFTVNVSSLSANTTYYVRAYAINSQGTAYGSNVSFTTEIVFNPILTYGSVTDVDGNIYKTIQIGTQVWMAENLKTTKYRNGNLIGTTTPATLDISAETSPKYQWACGGNESNVATYGRLYTWYAATDSRNICPSGWHLPTDAEWTTLTTFLGGETVAGGKLKETGTTHWYSPNTGATNSSGFTALPPGYRLSYGTFGNIGHDGRWWSSTENHTSNAWYKYLYYLSSYANSYYNLEAHGFSVRCLRDN